MLQSHTDTDGLGDGYEVKTVSQQGETKGASDPNNADSDGDGVIDGGDENCWFPTEWAHRNWGQPLENDFIGGLVKAADVKVFDAKGKEIPFSRDLPQPDAKPAKADKADKPAKSDKAD